MKEKPLKGAVLLTMGGPHPRHGEEGQGDTWIFVFPHRDASVFSPDNLTLPQDVFADVCAGPGAGNMALASPGPGSTTQDPSPHKSKQDDLPEASLSLSRPDAHPIHC